MKSGKVLVGIIVGAALIVGASTVWNIILNQPGPLQQEMVLQVERGMGVARIAETLHARQAIASPAVFKLASRTMRLDRAMQAGEYLLEPGISVQQIMRKLALGQVRQYKFTVPEGTTSADVARLLEENDKLTGETPEIPEGTILPETYAYTAGESRADVVTRMRNAMQTTLALVWEMRAPDLPLETPEELLILASLVEKETGIPNERDKVAGVYVNRLNKKMRLQADPTVIYGIENFDGNLTRAHLNTDHPYNTYTRHGLPAGPIANPGKAALLAAARPARVPYLFFVAGDDGGHVFAETYEEHKKNVDAHIRAYQQRFN